MTAPTPAANEDINSLMCFFSVWGSQMTICMLTQRSCLTGVLSLAGGQQEGTQTSGDSVPVHNIVSHRRRGDTSCPDR